MVKGSGMKFTRKSECALLGIIYLVKHGDDHLCFVREIARELDLPQKLLAQVFYKLAQNGLLKSHRGRGGGYTIGRKADQITVKDVVQAVQGEPLIYKCAVKGDVCATYKKCSIQDVLAQVQEEAMESLDRVTLYDLTEKMVFS